MVIDEKYGSEAGGMRARIRARDWSSTTLGPIGGWPPSLSHSVDLILDCPLPMVVLWGPEGILLYNDAYAVVAGARHPALLGRPVLEAWPEAADLNRRVLETVLAGDTLSLRDEYLVLYRQGLPEDVWFDLTYSPIRDEHGAPAGVLAIVVDTTERLQKQREGEARRQVQVAQARLAFALEAAGVGYWDLDLKTNEAMRSASHDRIFGYSMLLPNWTFGTFVEHVHPEDRPHVVESFKRAGETGEDWDFEARIRRVDGEPRWIAAHGRSERDADGKPVRMLGVVLDVTERRELLEREQQARAEADRASRAKDEFLAMLGHELRNPLAPIHTALQLMRLRGDGGAERERAVIERQVTHLTRLVDDLLDVARIARGKVDLKRERVELAEVVAKAIETVSPLLEQRTHALTVDVPRRGLAVDGDPVRLAQVVSNLLSNAAKYTDPGGNVSISAELCEGDVVLRVRDTGVGLSAELLPNVFELFVQGPQSLDRSQGGLGLGLTIVRSLVALHGGRVDASSEGPGRGSEFVVRLPAAPASVAADVPHPGAPAVAPRMTARRVLIVDDNTDAAEMLATAVESMGYATRVAYDGPEALRACASFTPEMAVLDIGLPVMDGYELAGRIRALPGLGGIYLLAVTGYGQESDRRRTQAAGFDRHLVKPVDLDALRRALEDGAHAHRG